MIQNLTNHYNDIDLDKIEYKAIQKALYTSNQIINKRNHQCLMKMMEISKLLIYPLAIFILMFIFVWYG